jgi:hypothetical protein
MELRKFERLSQTKESINRKFCLDLHPNPKGPPYDSEESKTQPYLS